MTFRAPVDEFQFLFDHVLDLATVTDTDMFSEITPDVRGAILAEAGRLSEEIMAPLQRVGDEVGSKLVDGRVKTPPGFAAGYRAIAEGGWVGMSADPEDGGMGLPLSVTSAVNEMMSAACLALQLNPLMSQAQIEALSAHASADLKSIYLPKLVSGAWIATMNLTEPQAGSDVGALRTSARKNKDGTYSITGQKIFISWADADFAENVCHLVLARLPGAAEGTKGISLFMVPKFLPDEDGNPGTLNDLSIVGLEKKMGLHGSPTAVMAYEGATGWLVGEEHNGMAAMFTMMNNARLGVGFQGIGQAEGAYQHALAYAMERRQGKSPIENGHGTIIDHADVRCMLATMKAEVFAARALALDAAIAIDLARATGKSAHAARAALLTPIAKAFGTDTGCTVSNLGIQVHGGAGFIEETGAAQYFRDVRVTAIYEGTNGIQAMDLVNRKLRDGGETMFGLIADFEKTVHAAKSSFPDMAERLSTASDTLRAATHWLVAQSDMNERYAGATAYLRGVARILGAHYHLKAALADASGEREKLARFYARRLLPEYAVLLEQATSGTGELYNITFSEPGQ